jgi:hypothetical protein
LLKHIGSNVKINFEKKKNFNTQQK